jgi:hypothetical protein
MRVIACGGNKPFDQACNAKHPPTRAGGCLFFALVTW